MDNAKINHTYVITCVGRAMFVGDKTIEDGVVKTTYDLLDHILTVIDQGNKKEYYFDKISLPVNNLEDAVRLSCGKEVEIYSSVDGFNFKDVYTIEPDEDGEPCVFVEHLMDDGAEIPF